MKKKIIIIPLLIIAAAVLAAAVTGTKKKVYPAFDLDNKELTALIQDDPNFIKENVQRDPKRFLELMEQVLSERPILFYLVDKTHPLPLNYVPEDLVFLVNHGIKVWKGRDFWQLSKILLEDTLEMVKAAESEGINLIFSSAYRPFDMQERIYNRYVKNKGQVEADKYSAKPGRSQHQLGLVVDFGSITDSFGKSKEGIWMKANAHLYGYSLSYPDGYEDVTGYGGEPWHYRYIGKTGTKMEMEFFNGIQQYMLVFLNKNRYSFEKVQNK